MTRFLDSAPLRRLTLLAMLLAMGTALAACENTIRGIGEDAEDTGEAVEDAVE